MFASLVPTFNDRFREMKFVMSWMPCFLFTNCRWNVFKLTNPEELCATTTSKTFDYRCRHVMAFRVPHLRRQFPRCHVASARQRVLHYQRKLKRKEINVFGNKNESRKLRWRPRRQMKNPRRILIKEERFSDDADPQAHNLWWNVIGADL